MKINQFPPLNSFDEAKNMATQHWSQFTKWSSETNISYEGIISHLEQIYNEMIQNRERYDNSRSSKVTRLLNEYELAKIYRHFRDFGSLRHFNYKKDIDFDTIIFIVLNELNSLSENKLEKLFPTLEEKNFLTVFLEDEQFTKNLYLNLMKHPTLGIYFLYLGDEVFFQATDFLKINLKQTLNYIPPDSLDSSGFSKMFRIITGVLIYAYYANDFEMTEKSFLKILKISYYFSVSHPLIDNILDSNRILSEKEKKIFGDFITDILNGKDVSKNILNIQFMKELYRCCNELQKLVPFSQNQSVYNYIKITHLAQCEDSYLKMEQKIDSDELFINIILKAAFIRISAASLTEYSIDRDFVLNSLIMGLNNQLSNDLEGTLEDYKNEVVTPYTLYLNNSIAVNPIDITMQYMLFSSRFYENSYLFIRVSLLRFVETIREFVKNYGKDQYQIFLNKVLNRSVLASQRHLLDKIGEISFYSSDVHQETFLLDYFDNAAKKYISN